METSSHLDQHLKSHLLLRLEDDDKPDNNEVHLYLTGEDESAPPDQSINQRRTSSGQDEVLVNQLDELNRTLFVKTTTYDEDLLIHTGR